MAAPQHGQHVGKMPCRRRHPLFKKMGLNAPIKLRLKPGLGKLVNGLLIAGPLFNIHGWLGAMPSALQAVLLLTASM